MLRTNTDHWLEPVPSLWLEHLFAITFATGFIRVIKQSCLSIEYPFSFYQIDFCVGCVCGDQFEKKKQYFFLKYCAKVRTFLGFRTLGEGFRSYKRSPCRHIDIGIVSDGIFLWFRWLFISSSFQNSADVINRFGLSSNNFTMSIRSWHETFLQMNNAIAWSLLRHPVLATQSILCTI